MNDGSGDIWTLAWTFGLLRLPLPPVLLIAIPLSIAVTWAMRRNVAS